MEPHAIPERPVRRNDVNVSGAAAAAVSGVTEDAAGVHIQPTTVGVDLEHALATGTRARQHGHHDLENGETWAGAHTKNPQQGALFVFSLFLKTAIPIPRGYRPGSDGIHCSISGYTCCKFPNCNIIFKRRLSSVFYRDIGK